MIIGLCLTPEAYINQCLFIRRRGYYIKFLHFQFLRPDFLKRLTSSWREAPAYVISDSEKSHEIPLDPPPISSFSPIVMKDLYLKTNKLENSGFCTIQLEVVTQPRGKYSRGYRGPGGSGHA